MDVGKGFISLFLGLLISTVGQDTGTGIPRLDFGIIYLWGKIDFIPVAVGLMGLSEIVLSINENLINVKNVNKYKFKDIFPNFKELISCLPSAIRGSLIGFFTGVLPGAGATIATI
jgi:putative tricarboxylic transport membrane protein